MKMEKEGVTRFILTYKKSKPVSAGTLIEVNQWRNLFHRLGWIGQDKHRYGGLGFGNISRRLKGNSFIVTGTQTGRLLSLTKRHYAIVIECHPYRNTVSAKGPVPPSSESMTHATIYDRDRTANVVIHVHAPILWKNARKLGIPLTKPAAKYGTPEMVREVERLMKSSQLKKIKVFAMGGHRDGIISYGPTADEAGLPLLILRSRI